MKENLLQEEKAAQLKVAENVEEKRKHCCQSARTATATVVDQKANLCSFLFRFLHKQTIQLVFYFFCGRSFSAHFLLLRSGDDMKLILIIDNRANEISSYKNHKFFIISPLLRPTDNFFSAKPQKMLRLGCNFFQELMRFLSVR